MTKALPYNPQIARKVRDGTVNGVKVSTIFGQIQKMKNAPKSLNTFYKHYGPTLYDARASVANAVGNRVLNQALNGDPKLSSTFNSQELFLKSKGGWHSRRVEEHREVQSEEVETEEAIRALMFHLGMNTD